MTQHQPSVYAIELGASLRDVMHRAGLNGKQTAKRLRWSQSRLSRLLTGQRHPQLGDVEAFLTLCQVDDETERSYFLTLA